MTNLILIATVGISAVQAPTILDNDFAIALGAAGLTANTAVFDPEMLAIYAQGEFATPLYRVCHTEPWRTPFYLGMYRRALKVTAGDPAATLSTASRMIGLGSRRSLLGNPIAQAEERIKVEKPLRAALTKMKAQGLIVGAIPSADDVPFEVRSAAALVLEVALDAIKYRRASFSDIDDIALEYSRVLAVEAEADPQAYKALVDLYRTVEMKYLLAASQDLAAAVQKAQSKAQVVSASESYGYRVSTVWGEIVLTGGDDSMHEDNPTLLLIDTGGSDTYLNVPSNASSTNWLSVVIDTHGSDSYLSDLALKQIAVPDWDGRKDGQRELGPGAAAFGVTFLVDSLGDDLYRTHRTGLGSAVFGASMLIDMDGNDVYDAYTSAQGFGRFGVGVLEDLAGDDSYSGFMQVQGVGLTAGFGAVIDRAGDDTYVANDTVIDMPSAQSAEHNFSMAQGAGFGVRSDYLTGHSLSGGVGLLYDIKGSDSYSCAVFGQGTGYWQALGMLWDDAGDDKYYGMWYVQGASAHFGLGYLEDKAGADEYIAVMNMAQGAGHDFGTGYLIDRGGNDTYRAPNLSLGAGNANGIGIFYDAAGDDVYESRGTTLGKANAATKGSIRERALCLGVFIDMSGVDTYPDGTPWARNGVKTASWTDRAPTPAESQLGVFWDK
ncbi:MAG: hypothetical protein IH944_06590 [Armatimonadetes bacterium]|nr:hypothetical protein [Armatimonadota bacterium]